jgi:undecaprenyl-diphosphatase
MTIVQAVLLGIVQGLTEFVPVSSSGHLVLLPWLLGWQIDPQTAFLFDVLVQMGTLVAVFIYFRSDIFNLLRETGRGLFRGKPFETPTARLGWLILASSLPAAIVGLLLKDFVADTFEDPRMVAIFLLITALLLWIAERLGTREKELTQVTLPDALWIGAAQILALFPGISRSGATISAGLARNLDRPVAARFSFLMALPIMVGAGLIAVLDVFKIDNASGFMVPILIGSIIAAIIGYLAIRWLISYLSRHSLRIFTYYCAVLGIFVLILDAIRG